MKKDNSPKLTPVEQEICDKIVSHFSSDPHSQSFRKAYGEAIASLTFGLNEEQKARIIELAGQMGSMLIFAAIPNCKGVGFWWALTLENKTNSYVALDGKYFGAGEKEATEQLRKYLDMIMSPCDKVN